MKNKRRFWMEIHRHWKSEARFNHYQIYATKSDVPKVLQLCNEYGIECEVSNCVDVSIVVVKL